MNRYFLAAAPIALMLTACTGTDGNTGDATDGTGAGNATGTTEVATETGEEAAHTLSVSTAFYPLHFAVEQIGGERVSVVSLTPPGAEAHDVELTPREVARLVGDDLIVYLSGFQPAVDQAVENVASDHALDVSTVVDLIETADEHADHEDDDHEDDGHEDDDHDDDHGATDPHFWLDPQRYAAVAAAIGDRLADADPDHAQEYAAAAEDFQSRLTDLDDEFTTALAACTHRDLVTGHAAFGYLADRYDLHQVGIAGLTPDSEPSPTQLRDLVIHVRESGVSTVYAETLVDPALAETIAREADVEVAVLDPLEGLTDSSAGSDYFEVMRSNLAVLAAGQDCS